MNKLSQGLTLVLLGTIGSASAAITGTETVGFCYTSATMLCAPGAVPSSPKATKLVDGMTYTPNDTANSPSSGSFINGGLSFGPVNDPTISQATPHLHNDADAITGYRNTATFADDSTGFYFNATDGSMFSAQSLYFNSEYSASTNPNTQASQNFGAGGDGGSNDYWDVYGFASASNPGLVTAATYNADGYISAQNTPNQGATGTIVAHTEIANGYAGLVNLIALDPNFADVGAIWIHYHGYAQNSNDYILYDANDNPLASNVYDPNTGGQYVYQAQVDYVTVGAAVSAVPVPGTVWLFGSALAGLISMRRKKA
jgi:hypothetical protein